MLRYLQPSLPISHFQIAMKPSPKSIKPSRMIPIFSRVFPHKFRFLSNGSLSFGPKSRNSYSNGSVVRRFSTRVGGRRGVGSGHEGVKSLVDDEADLSDWVSGLSSKDYTKTKFISDSDGDNGGFNDDYGKGRGRGRDSGMGDDRDGKRRKESGFERFKGRGGEGGSRGGGRAGGGMEGRNGGRDSRGGFEMERSGGREMRGGRSDMGRGGMRRGDSGGREMRGGRSDMGRGGVRSGENGGREVRGGRSDMGRGGVRSGENGGREVRGGRSDMGRGGVRSGDNPTREMRGGRSNVGRGGIRYTDRRRGFGLSDADEDGTEDQKGFKSFKELMGSDEDEDEDDSVSEEEEEDGDLINKESVLAWRQTKDVDRISPPSSPSGGESYLTETRFDQFSVSPSTLKALKDAGYEKMTIVQEATLPAILNGKDVLAKARTGTGKTVAFLLPSIEVVEKTPPASRDQKRPPILVLVMCPTRELACQAAAEANKLLKYHPSLGVQVVIGGTRLSLEQKRMQANPCQILVATPGRLKDHIENTAGFATRLTGIKVLVLDEADHLLDMGFRKDIERIIAAVPKQRQTLLFSATIPPEVRQICHIALKRDHEYINTVQEGSEETHTQVQQTHLVATLDNHFSLLYTLLKDHIADNVDYKVLVFCTTAMVTRLISELLGELNLNVREIHSRKSQSYRTKVSDEFRKSKGLILVTSDVSARGVDYPDVSLVVQLGVPADRQQYIHRLGRTGRKGKEGQGVLLLAPWEEYFLSTLKDLPITKAPVPLVDPESKKKVERSLSRVGMKEKESAYQAWLGYYNSNKNIGKDKYRLVELANEFSRTMGLDNPPAIPKMILGKMGLKNIPGLRSK